MLGAGMALLIQSETLASAAVVKPLCVLLNVADAILFQLCLNLRRRSRSAGSQWLVRRVSAGEGNSAMRHTCLHLDGIRGTCQAHCRRSECWINAFPYSTRSRPSCSEWTTGCPISQ